MCAPLEKTAPVAKKAKPAADLDFPDEDDLDASALSEFAS
mgnify:CR=1 FL=1